MGRSKVLVKKRERDQTLWQRSSDVAPGTGDTSDVRRDDFILICCHLLADI